MEARNTGNQERSKLAERSKLVGFGALGGVLGGMSWEVIVEGLKTLLFEYVCR